MPKIPNWQKWDMNAVPPGFIWVWENESTGERVAVSEKVPNDGYYSYRFRSGELIEAGSGERIAFTTRKSDAKTVTAGRLRKNTEGWDNGA